MNSLRTAAMRGESAHVVLAVRHVETALQQVGHALRGIVQVARHPHAEQAVGVEVGGVERVDVRAQLLAERARQRRDRVDGRDPIEQRLERRQPLRLDRRLVHVAGVVVGRLLRHGAAQPARLWRLPRAAAACAAPCPRSSLRSDPTCCGPPESPSASTTLRWRTRRSRRQDRRSDRSPVEAVRDASGDAGASAERQPANATAPASQHDG